MFMQIAWRTGAALIVAATIFGVMPIAVAAPPPSTAASAMSRQTDFASADDAVKALIAAVTANDDKTLLAILGPGGKNLVSSGDPVADREARQQFVESYTTRHELVADAAGHMVLQVGANDWPLPLPVVSVAGRWHFDSTVGAQAIVDRRIGRNELAAIGVLFAIVDAEKDFYARRAEAGSGEYAQRIVSTAHTHDGLYWDEAAGKTPSPLAKLVEKAVSEGYPGELVGGQRIPYQGYYFEILKAQGALAPEGAQSYVKAGRMTGGFAAIAWPAQYGASGLTTFLISQDRIVFQKDLGPETNTRAAGFKKFDPDLSWARVDVVDR